MIGGRVGFAAGGALGSSTGSALGGAVGAAAGSTAGAWLGDKISDWIDDDTDSDEDCEKKKSCLEKYPNLVKCYKLSRYHLWSRSKNTQIVKDYLRNEGGRSGGIVVKRDGTAHSGPCVGKGGEHYKIRQRSAFIGTCNMCPCCKDTADGAEKWYGWDVNAY